MALTYINFYFCSLQSIIPAIPDNILEHPFIQSLVACLSFLKLATASIKGLISGVPTIIVGCVINIIN